MVVPNCYYQIDFVCGAPLTNLGPAGSNIFYSAQGRLIDADNGGTCAYTCTTANGSLAGNIFVDCNNDGVRQPLSEGVLAGVKVALTGTTLAGNAVALTTTTDGSGNYKFSNLWEGVYTVTETDPSGYVDGKSIAGNAGGTVGTDVISKISLGAGVAATGYNFAELKPASICGTVVYSKNGSGIGGVLITLSGIDDLGNTVKITATTDSSGNYSFGSLRAGTYNLCETLPSGYKTTSSTCGSKGGSALSSTISTIKLTWADAATGYKFGNA